MVGMSSHSRLSNYDKVLQKVNTEGVRIIGLISPPRVVSTAIEIAIAESPDIDGQINEPFHLSVTAQEDLSQNAEQRAYGDILRRIEETQAKAGRKNVTLVMKEMAKNVAPGAAFDRWQSITDKQVVILRNPLSNTESIIRKLAEVMAERPDLTGVNLNDYAKARGFTDESGLGRHWDALVKHVKKTNDYRPLGDALKEIFPKSNLYRQDPEMQAAYLDLATNETAKKAGFSSLDEFAAKAGHPSWKTMRRSKAGMETYAPILDAQFAFMNAGWESMSQHLPQMKNPVIIDSTVLRAAPVETMRELSRYLGIRFDEKMVSGWERANGENFDRGHGRTGSSVFIQKAVTSTGINKPDEVPLPLANFPPDFQDYLTQKAIPAYTRMMASRHRLGAHGKLADTALLESAVTDGTKLKDRDPVFSYTLIATDADYPAAEKAQALAKIRQQYDERYGEAFTAIDRTVAAMGEGADVTDKPTRAATSRSASTQGATR